MRVWLRVAIKEARENLRDRRTLFFSLIYGPIVLPLLMLGPMFFAAKDSMVDHEEPLELSVIGAEHAPGLMAELAARNIRVGAAPDDWDKTIIDGTTPLVLVLDEDFTGRWRAGEAAPVGIYFNSARQSSRQQLQRVRTALLEYQGQVGWLRMAARGIDPALAQPLTLVEEDLANTRMGEGFISGSIYFMMMFNIIMGAFYLAVDTTAGERERNSLETLLSLPLGRGQLVLGKGLAVATFSAVSALLVLLTLTLFALFMPMDEAPSMVRFHASDVLQLIPLALVLCLLGAALLLTVASFARSVKEAQTYLGLLFLFPLLPVGLAQLVTLELDWSTCWVPFLGHFLLVGEIIRGEALPWVFVAVSTGCTLLAAAVVSLVPWRLYAGERFFQAH